MAACLALGPAAVACHRAAAALWKLDGIEPGVIEIYVPNDRTRPSPEVIIRRTRSLPRSDTTKLGRFPLTTAVRTLLDLGSVVDEDQLEAAFESAYRRGLTDPDRAQRRLRNARKPRGGGPEKDSYGQRKRGAGRQRPGSEVHPPCAQRSPSTVRGPVESARRRWPSRSHRLRLPGLTPGGRSRRKGLTYGPGGRGARFSTAQSADRTGVEDAVFRLERRRQSSGARSSRHSFRARPATPCRRPARESGSGCARLGSHFCAELALMGDG